MNLTLGETDSMISTDDFQSEASLSLSEHISSNPQAKNVSMRSRLNGGRHQRVQSPAELGQRSSALDGGS